MQQGRGGAPEVVDDEVLEAKVVVAVEHYVQRMPGDWLPWVTAWQEPFRIAGQAEQLPEKLRRLLREIDDVRLLRLGMLGRNPPVHGIQVNELLFRARQLPLSNQGEEDEP